MRLKSISSSLYTMFLVCLTERSNSADKSSKVIPSSNLRFRIALSRSEKIHLSIRISHSGRDRL